MKNMLIFVAFVFFFFIGLGCEESKKADKKTNQNIQDEQTEGTDQLTETEENKPLEVLNLTAYSSSEKIDINWTDPDVDGFDHVELAWEPDGLSMQKVQKGENKFTATNLTNGTLYTFTVKAVYGDGTKSAGTTIASTPSGMTAPGEITSLKSLAEGSTITITWQDPSDSLFDHVEILVNGDPSTKQIVEKGAQTYLISGITSAVTITVKTVYSNGTLSTGVNMAVNQSDLYAPRTKISAGYGHTLILKKDGTLYGMGRNDYGQLGDGTRENSYQPKQLMTGVLDMSAGNGFSLIILKNGILFAMGRNDLGQLGDNSTTDRLIPTQVTFVTNPKVRKVSAGSNHSLVLKSNGELWGSGTNDRGQFGDGTRESSHKLKLLMTGIQDIAAGADHSLILKTDRTLWVTGNNYTDPRWTCTQYCSLEPVYVSNNVSKISASVHSLFIKKDGSLWGMEYNEFGQLGLGNNTKDVWISKFITNGAVKISAGLWHSLVLKSSGLWVTGYNAYGQLGDGSTNDRNLLCLVMSDVIEISAGGDSSFFVKSDDTIWGMGSNFYGQLGNGTTINQSWPVKIVLPSSIGASISSLTINKNLIGIAIGSAIIAICAIAAIIIYRKRNKRVV